MLFFCASTFAIIAPNTSLATVPVGYFGGNAQHRGDANVAMLAKMRIVMIEKWEGPCWTECLNNSKSPSCQAGCAVENDMLETLRRVKAANPAVATVFYFNTLLAFPFYSINGVYEANDALTIDSTTKKPIVRRIFIIVLLFS